MYLLEVADNFSDRVNELGLLAALILSTVFYKEYKKQMLEMEHDDMIDRFLNDW